jgi:uncharacterized iron-regulated protein
MNRQPPFLVALVACALLLAGCAIRDPHAGEEARAAARELRQQLMPTPLLLVGEQHDAAEHQALQAALVQQLSTEHTLAALVIEMAEAGDSTADLPATSDEAAVRRALRWEANRQAWPWAAYGPAIMAAVRAGVPVLGGNLPATDMRAAMRDAALDGALNPAALREQQDQIREGHCKLLPESQIAPMTRIQIASDQSLARTAISVLQPGKTVLLFAGNQHVRRDLGVPAHLPAGQAHRSVMALPTNLSAGANAEQVDRLWLSPALAPRDHCAEFLQQQKQR